MPLLKNYIQEKDRAVTNRAAFLLIGILSSLLSLSQKSVVVREYKKLSPLIPIPIRIQFPPSQKYILTIGMTDSPRKHPPKSGK